MYNASKYHCMGRPCATFNTNGDVSPIDSAARKTPVKCHTISKLITMRIKAPGLPFLLPPSRCGVAGRGLGAGAGGGALIGFTGAPTMGKSRGTGTVFLVRHALEY